MVDFPFSMHKPVRFSGPLPAQTDVVVIGGGIIGVTSALYLADAGHSVVLLEKGRIAAEQSSRNWGWIRQQGRDPDELPIMVAARQRWLELARRSGTDLGLRPGGVTYIAGSEKQLAHYAGWLPYAEANGVDTRILDAAAVHRAFPGIAGRLAGAITTPSDMRAEPWRAVPAMAAMARQAGAQIVEGCAVRCLDIEAGRVAGVITEMGRVCAGRVILAGGAWSSLFLRNHGISIPQLAVRESVIATHPLPDITQGAAALGDVAFRRRTDGGYTLAPGSRSELFIGPDAFRALPKYLPQLWANPLGQTYRPAAPPDFPDAWTTARRWSGDDTTPFEKMRILDPRPNHRHLNALKKKFAALFPRMPALRVRKAWAGMIDTMPDIVPVVDHCPALPGLIIGTGMSGHGFGIGPEMGRILAALATGGSVGHDLARFRASRFTDGSPIRLGPAL